MPDVKRRLKSTRVLSISISLVLDIIGFSKECIRKRICAFDKYSNALSRITKKRLERNDTERIVTGSIREGVGLYLLNDVDFLQIDHGVICGTDYHNFLGSGKLVFELVLKDAPCGYCFLRFLDETPTPTNGFLRLQHALVNHKGDMFLSSASFIASTEELSLGKGIFYYNDRLRTRHGPSLRKVEDTSSFIHWLSVQADLPYMYDETSDFVKAFKCEGDSFLLAWKNRDRPSGWPYRKTTEHVMELSGYVVPVGQKGTEYEELQWRICFTDAEIYLVQALNSVQKKIFILLKLIAKHSLEPISADITSYIMKNVILWLAEKIPQKKFRRKHLLVRLKDALIYLRECVSHQNLPNYMIPSRNMFTGKFQGDEQLNVINKLDYFQENAKNLVQEISMYIINSKDGQKHLISIVIASLVNECKVLQLELYSEDHLAYFLESLLKCETYMDRLSVVIRHSLKFFCMYGNRPMCIELTLRSRFETVLKQQGFRLKLETGGNKLRLKKSDKKLSNESLPKTKDKWVVPSQLFMTLCFLFISSFYYVLSGTNYIVVAHTHVYLLVLYNWFLDDKKRETNCKILSIFYCALAVEHLYKSVMICGISGYFFKPFILHRNLEGNVMMLVYRWEDIFVPLMLDSIILQLNAETI